MIYGRGKYFFPFLTLEQAGFKFRGNCPAFSSSAFPLTVYNQSGRQFQDFFPTVGENNRPGGCTN
jgi:hypothetical protein